MAEVSQTVEFKFQGAGNLPDFIRKARLEAEQLKRATQSQDQTRAFQQQGRAAASLARELATVAAVAGGVLVGRATSGGSSGGSSGAPTSQMRSSRPVKLPPPITQNLYKQLRDQVKAKHVEAREFAELRDQITGRAQGRALLERDRLIAETKQLGREQSGISKQITGRQTEANLGEAGRLGDDELKALQNQRKSLSARIASAKKKADESVADEGEKATVEAQIDRLTREHGEISSRIEGAQAVKAAGTTAGETAGMGDEELKALQTKRRSLSLKITNAKKKADKEGATDEEKATIQEEIDRLTRERTEVTTRIEGAQVAKTSATSTADATDDELKALRDQQTALAGQITDQRKRAEEIAKAENERAAVREEIDRLTKERGEVTTRIDAARTARTAGEARESLGPLRQRRDELQTRIKELQARGRELKQIAERSPDEAFNAALNANYKAREEQARYESEFSRREVAFLREKRRDREGSRSNVNQALRAEFERDRQAQAAGANQELTDNRQRARNLRSPSIQNTEVSTRKTRMQAGFYGERAALSEAQADSRAIESTENRRLQGARARRQLMGDEANALKSQLVSARETTKLYSSQAGQAQLRENARMQREIARETGRTDYRRLIAEQGQFGGRAEYASRQLGKVADSLQGISAIATGTFFAGSAAITGFAAAADPWVFEELKFALADTSAVIGRDFVPIFRTATDYVRQAGDWWMGLNDAQQETAVSFVTWTLGLSAGLMIIPRVIGGIRGLIVAMNALRVASMTNPLGIAVALAGIGIGAYAAYRMAPSFDSPTSQMRGSKTGFEGQVSAEEEGAIAEALREYARATNRATTAQNQRAAQTAPGGQFDPNRGSRAMLRESQNASFGQAGRSIIIETPDAFRNRLQQMAGRLGATDTIEQQQLSEAQVQTQELKKIASAISGVSVEDIGRREYNTVRQRLLYGMSEAEKDDPRAAKRFVERVYGADAARIYGAQPTRMGGIEAVAGSRSRAAVVDELRQQADNMKTFRMLSNAMASQVGRDPSMAGQIGKTFMGRGARDYGLPGEYSVGLKDNAQLLGNLSGKSLEQQAKILGVDVPAGSMNAPGVSVSTGTFNPAQASAEQLTALKEIARILDDVRSGNILAKPGGTGVDMPTSGRSKIEE